MLWGSVQSLDFTREKCSMSFPTKVLHSSFFPELVQEEVTLRGQFKVKISYCKPGPLVSPLGEAWTLSPSLWGRVVMFCEGFYTHSHFPWSSMIDHLSLPFFF
jgi:hypothetical protein